MKITDEQIREIFTNNGFKLSNETGDDLKQYVYSAARELITLAQEVPDLVWVDYRSCGYEIDGDGFFWTVNYEDVPISPSLETKKDAFKFANEHNRKRILSQLKYGGE